MTRASVTENSRNSCSTIPPVNNGGKKAAISETEIDTTAKPMRQLVRPLFSTYVTCVNEWRVATSALTTISFLIQSERLRMKKLVLDCLTERHLLLFGTIIQWFARYELLMQEIMATVAGSDSACVMLLTRGLDFDGKRQALLDLLRHRVIPLDQFDRVNAFLIVPHTLTPLRNDIAHSAWISAPYPNSIQPDWILRLPPSVEPLRDNPNVPSGNLVERDEEKVAYSIDDLYEIVENLAANHARFSNYLHEVGLIR